MPDRAVAVVTGANRGIGREVVRQLAEHGFLVVLGARDRAAGERAAREMDPSGQRVIARQLDVTSDDDVGALADELDRVDVLVNNAAILYDTWARGVGADLDELRAALETNLLGAWRMVNAFAGHLRRCPHPRIVNISSEGGSLASMGAGTPAYSVSKAALNAMTRIVAAELRGDGVLVNSVCPGWTATDMGGHGGRPVRDGAASVVWAALLPDDGPTGGFFRDGRPLPW
jgi:NAD(P)-dependent dehydrogenase (short-subunit alcohol dehydrogenase family)